MGGENKQKKYRKATNGCPPFRERQKEREGDREREKERENRRLVRKAGSWEGIGQAIQRSMTPTLAH